MGNSCTPEKSLTLCCVYCALWKIRVWADNLDMLARTKAVRAESRCSHRGRLGENKGLRQQSRARVLCWTVITTEAQSISGFDNRKAEVHVLQRPGRCPCQSDSAFRASRVTIQASLALASSSPRCRHSSLQKDQIPGLLLRERRQTYSRSYSDIKGWSSRSDLTSLSLCCRYIEHC